MRQQIDQASFGIDDRNMPEPLVRHLPQPSAVKRMIDVGSTDHVYVDMAFKCGAEIRANCEMLLNEFKEVNLFIRKVYQKQYIVSAEGTPAWHGVDSLD